MKVDRWSSHSGSTVNELLCLDNMILLRNTSGTNSRWLTHPSIQSEWTPQQYWNALRAHQRWRQEFSSHCTKIHNEEKKLEYALQYLMQGAQIPVCQQYNTTSVIRTGPNPCYPNTSMARTKLVYDTEVKVPGIKHHNYSKHVHVHVHQVHNNGEAWNEKVCVSLSIKAWNIKFFHSLLAVLSCLNMLFDMEMYGMHVCVIEHEPTANHAP